MYARKLSENKAMLTCIREAVQGGMPCLAECGGFLYLHESLADPEQKEYQMAGVIKGKAASQGKLVRFGYICIEGQKDGAYLKNGEVIRGHEFHYWYRQRQRLSCGEAGQNTFLAVYPYGRKSFCRVSAFVSALLCSFCQEICKPVYGDRRMSR